jgi:transcriptional regulator with PAS, ATPase and Fis domain
MKSLLLIESDPELEPMLQREFSNEVAIQRIADPAFINNGENHDYDLILWRVSSCSDSWNLDELQHRFTSRTGVPVVIIAPDKKEVAVFGGTAEREIHVLRELDGVENVCTIVRSKLLDTSAQRADAISVAPFEFEGIVATSLAMREIISLIEEAASANIAVLITGETGTGKELVAAAIHKRSGRREFPYIAVNTGAMNPELVTSELFGHEKGSYTGAVGSRAGFFEQANRGTIFLDEISTMDERSQVSLLRVLETKSFRRVGGIKDIHVDVRVIAATNENLEEAIKEKKFREDLYYRLDVFRIHLPPLRSRPGAIELLTDHFVTHYDQQFGKKILRVSRETYRYMRLYPWPGNVRELKNVVQRAVLKAPGDELTPDLLPARIREQVEVKTQSDGLRLRVGMTLEAAERDLIRMTLAFTKGNKKAAGEMLGISRRALYNKLKKFDL